MILFDLWRKLDFRGTTGIILWYFHSHWHHCFSLSGLCVTVHAKSQLDRESSFDCLVRTDDRGATVGWALVFSSMVEWFIVCLRNCAACNPSPLPIGDDDDGGLWVIMTLPAVLGIACGTCMFSRCMKYGCRKCNASVTALSVLPSNQQLFHRPLPHLLQATLTPSLFHHRVSFELLRQHNNKQCSLWWIPCCKILFRSSSSASNKHGYHPLSPSYLGPMTCSNQLYLDVEKSV